MNEFQRINFYPPYIIQKEYKLINSIEFAEHENRNLVTIRK